MSNLGLGGEHMNNEQQFTEECVDSIGWTFDDIVHALRFFSVPTNIPVSGFSIDSRDVAPGEAFIALKGESFDGHDFLAQAYERGAVLAIVQHDVPALDGRSYLRVKDTELALLDLAQYARAKTSATIVGVSGSVGKTTVRTWVAELLSTAGSTVSSKKNFNGKIGLPLSMTALTSQTNFGIFEIGIDSPGAMQPLATLCRPHVAIITPLAHAHMKNFNSMDLLAHEKALICSGLCLDGLLIVDLDSSNYFPGMTHLAKEYGAIDVVSVGDKPEASVRIVNVKTVPSDTRHKVPGSGMTHVTLESKGVSFEFSIAAVGRHAVLNSALAFTGAVGAAFEGTWTDIISEHASDIRNVFLPCMGRLQLLPGRGKIFQCDLSPSRKITIVDDSYNANLTSMLSGLESFELLLGSRKIAVIGDMLELGDFSEQSHIQLFDAISSSSVDKVFCIGDLCAAAFSRLPLAKQGCIVGSISELDHTLRDFLVDGDAVWIKASHTVGLHEIAQSFVQGDVLASREAA
jgi:UDP-N-acetylmuramoyl-tripeptide--D-alanyl-D-alanine ligase